MPRTRNRERKEGESSLRSGDPKGPKRRTKDGCLCCRARRKKCSLPSSTSEDCETCRDLNIQCLRGYGQKRPKWMQDKRRLQEFTDAIADWTGNTNNRKGPCAPPPLVLDHFQENTPSTFASPPNNSQENAHGSYIAYATTSAVPSTIGSTSSNNTSHIPPGVFPRQLGSPKAETLSSTSTIRTLSEVHSPPSTTAGPSFQSSAGFVDLAISSFLEMPELTLEFQSPSSSSGGRLDTDGLEQRGVDPRLLAINKGKGSNPFVNPNTLRRS